MNSFVKILSSLAVIRIFSCEGAVELTNLTDRQSDNNFTNTLDIYLFAFYTQLSTVCQQFAKCHVACNHIVNILKA